jgi:hypothetical protein
MAKEMVEMQWKTFLIVTNNYQSPHTKTKSLIKRLNFFCINLIWKMDVQPPYLKLGKRTLPKFA